MLTGIMPSKDRPHLVLAADVDWPPYAFIGPGPAFDNEGIGADMARGMGALCDIKVTIVQTSWGASPRELGYYGLPTYKPPVRLRISQDQGCTRLWMTSCGYKYLYR